MAEKRVSVRLAAIGGRQVRAELEGIGEAGTRGFGRLSREMEAANTRLAAFARRAGIAMAAAASAATAGLGIIVRNAAQSADQIRQFAQVANATPESFQRWASGARTVGVAVRVAERDLRALSAPLLTGEIVVNREGADLGPGDVIRLRSTRLGLDDVVMRISEIGQGDGRDNGIRLKIAEDVFALGATAIAGGRMPTGTGTGVAAPPRALARRMVEEAPYWLLVRELGHSEADRRLAEDPDAGALVATGERPSADALAAQLWVDPGTGPAQEGVVAFAPTALLAADVTDSPEARVIPVTGWRDIGEVEIGTLASIGGELVRVDGISQNSISVGRGCLDTVPRAHGSGTPVIFFDEMARITEDSWAAGETLAARLLPETGRGTLAFALTPEDAVTLDRRAIHPLPPGRVQGNGSYAPNVDALVIGSLALIWTHRDRLTQTSPVIVDHTGASIGPEPGVGYIIEVRWVDPDTGAAILPAGVVIDTGSAASWTLAPEAIPELGAPDRTAEIELAVRSRRLVEGSWVTDREARWFRLTAPFAASRPSCRPARPHAPRRCPPPATRARC